MKVVEVSWDFPIPEHWQLRVFQKGSLRNMAGTITLEDKDGDYLTFDIDLKGLPKTYENSTSDI